MLIGAKSENLKFENVLGNKKSYMIIQIKFEIMTERQIFIISFTPKYDHNALFIFAILNAIKYITTDISMKYINLSP
ncbi:hypothetical protein HMPREF1871_00269 [Gemelliphila asaccharolytica]|uniref:Transposase n=1 Tax=Gemelliphila asaccharolytica TaxID=502393 RepID=A0ABR5TMX9_9BACL|nr:hypothetical protein HMPREF1871_00269 [Gemella asaccharolytica]